MKTIDNQDWKLNYELIKKSIGFNLFFFYGLRTIFVGIIGLIILVLIGSLIFYYATEFVIHHLLFVITSVIVITIVFIVTCIGDQYRPRF
jgi:hypothetical protein